MLYCEKCRIFLSGSRHRCPLCQSALSGEPEGGETYPILSAGKNPLALRLAVLATVAILTVCAAINFSFPQNSWWCLLVAAGLASIWLLVWVARRKQSNPMKALVWLLAVGTALILLWDWRTGFAGWSINCVLPVLILCTQLAIISAVRVLRLEPPDYLLYLMICLSAGFLPLIPLLCGVLWFIYPSVICAGVSAVALAALILFHGPALKNEIIRRTHL